MPENTTFTTTTPTPDPSNSTILVSADGGTGPGLVPVTVEQGPRWLAALIIDPPSWVPMLLSLIALAAVIGAWAGWRRLDVDRLPADVARDQTFLACVVLNTVVVMQVVEPLALGYLADVAVGAVGGFVVSKGWMWLTWSHVERGLRERGLVAETEVAS